MTRSTERKPRETSGLSDPQLMRDLQEGSVTAFEELFDRHQRAAFSLALRMVGPSAAEDVTQVAFLAIWKGSDSYLPARGSVKNWVLGCVRFRAIDAMRREGTPVRSQTIPWDDEVGAQASSAAQPSRSPESIALRRHGERAALEAVEGISKDQREVLQLAFFAGLSHTEIATELGLPVGTVKGRIRLGLEKLRGSSLAAGV